MTETAAVLNQISADLQSIWQHHKLDADASSNLQRFRAEMADTLAKAAQDPERYMSISRALDRHAGGRAAPDRTAEPTQQPSSAASIDGWADAFAKASGMPRK